MGGGSSAQNAASDGDRTTSALAVHNLWTATWRTVDKSYDPKRSHVVNGPGWKTVRLYVSSTFDDFPIEREVLATKVFPELRAWAQERNIYLIDCDLKWGTTRESRTTEHLQMCLQEISRCHEDNGDCPFFFHMSCEKTGWIPDEKELTDTLQNDYRWVDGLSHTEMEVLHTAFRKGSPNAFFAIRKSDFIQTIPEPARKAFIDTHEMDRNKMVGLRKALRSRFHKDKMLNYSVKYKGQDPETGAVLCEDLEEVFAKPIVEYFKRRMEATFPTSATEGATDSDYTGHGPIMVATASGVKGQDDLINQLKQHLQEEQSDKLVLLIGGRGSGKSAIMASLGQQLESESLEKLVFYFNVAAEPAPSRTRSLLCTLLHDLNTEVDVNSSLEDICQVAHTALSSPDTRQCLLLVDGADELTDDPELTWLPRSLPANIRCVLSLDGASTQNAALRKAASGEQNSDSSPPSLVEVQVTELNDEAKKAIIEKEGVEWNFNLGNAEMETLMQNTGASNPQWVCVACRELAASGHVTGNRIDQLPTDLQSLYVAVLDRLEQEVGRALPQASLCLLYLSARGLHEVELLTLLADEENLLPRRRKTTGEFQKPEVDVTARLIASRWAALYRALLPYLTYYVTSGTRRMTLRYRGLGDAVRRRYLYIEDDDESGENQGQGENTEKIKWWQAKLSCCTEKS